MTNKKKILLHFVTYNKMSKPASYKKREIITILKILQILFIFLLSNNYCFNYYVTHSAEFRETYTIKFMVAINREVKNNQMRCANWEGIFVPNLGEIFGTKTNLL